MPACGQVGAVLYATCGGIAQVLGAVHVHQALAGHQPHVARQRGLEQRLHGLRVHGAIDAGAGGALSRQLVEEEGGRLGAAHRVGITRLGREGVALQPVEQPRRRRGDYIDLRQVEVGVDEARRDQRTAVIIQGGRRVAPVRDEEVVLAVGHHAPGFDHQQAILHEPDCPGAARWFGDEVKQGTAQQASVDYHHSTSASLRRRQTPIVRP